jgi:hypothetical protein
VHCKPKNIRNPLRSFQILGVKVMLKVKMVLILFLQIDKNYAKNTVETFTLDRPFIAYQIESLVWITGDYIARIRIYYI